MSQLPQHSPPAPAATLKRSTLSILPTCRLFSRPHLLISVKKWPPSNMWRANLPAAVHSSQPSHGRQGVKMLPSPAQSGRHLRSVNRGRGRVCPAELAAAAARGVPSRTVQRCPRAGRPSRLQARAGWVSRLLLGWRRNVVEPPGSRTYRTPRSGP